MMREEAINELKYAQAMCQFDPSTGEVGFRNKEDELQYEAFDMAIEALKAQQWIPCSERLPEGDVLCCDIHKNLMIGYVFVSECSNTGYNADSEQEYMCDCIAWMPLPEPYKEEEQ